MKHIKNFASQLSRTPFDVSVDKISIVVLALDALIGFLHRDKSKTITAFSTHFWSARDTLFSSRQYDPILSNALLYISENIFLQHTVSKSKTIAILRTTEAIKILQKISETINHFSFHKIPKGGVVFVQGCDHFIVQSLISAYKKGKRFRVILTECRPLLSGKKCAELLSKEGIPVHFFVDNELPEALRSADVVFIGSHMVSSTIAICPSGTVSLTEQARSRRAYRNSRTHHV